MRHTCHPFHFTPYRGYFLLCVVPHTLIQIIMFSVTTHLIDTGRCAEKVRRPKKEASQEKPRHSKKQRQEDGKKKKDEKDLQKAKDDVKTAKEFLKCLADWMPGKCLAFNAPVGGSAILAENGATAQWKHGDVEPDDYHTGATRRLQDWRPIAALMPLGERAQFFDCLIGSHLVTQV